MCDRLDVENGSSHTRINPLVLFYPKVTAVFVVERSERQKRQSVLPFSPSLSPDARPPINSTLLVFARYTTVLQEEKGQEEEQTRTSCTQ